MCNLFVIELSTNLFLLNMSSTGQKQTESRSLNDLLQQVGIDDIGTFVNQFRNKVNQENEKTSTTAQQPDFISMGSSFLNQVDFFQKQIDDFHRTSFI